MYNPKQQGFFPLIQMKIEEGLSLEDKQNYLTLDLSQKIQWIHDLPRFSSDHQDNVLRNILALDYGYKKKEKSEKQRESGNAQFYVGSYKQAQILYSSAIFTAPSDSLDLALAYANRSACFQKIGGREGLNLSLRDIQLALETSKYPEDKAFKLYERQGECYAVLGNADLAMKSYQMAMTMITKNSQKLPKDKFKKFISGIKKKLENLQAENKSNGMVTKKPEEDIHTEIDDRNDFFESAHAAVDIKYEPGRGRFAVATRDIEIGTTLFRETALTYALNPDKFGSHCQTCFKPIRGVIPCLKCTYVCFCSPECRKKADETFHKYECGIMKLFLESGLNVYPYLVLRLITNEGYENIMKMREDLENPDEQSGSSVAHFYSSSDFRNAYNLMSHEESITDEMWILRGLVAVFVLKCLKLTDFFPEKNCQNSLTNDEIFIGTVIFRLLNVMPCNSHDISEFDSPVSDYFAPGAQKVSIGAGLYPCLALLNHSCEPSFMRCNKGRQVICVSSKTIKKGQEISENYGLMYTMKDFKERQEICTEHYRFKCECKACDEKWPLLRHMKAEVLEDPDDKRMNRFSGIKCIHCGETIKRKSDIPAEPLNPKRTCLVCGQTTDLTKDIPLPEIKSISGKALNCLVKGQWKEGLELAKRTELLVTKHFSLPVLEWVEVQIAIWKCLWLKFGSMRLVKSL